MKLRHDDGWIPNRIVHKEETYFLEFSRLQYPRPRERFIAFDLEKSDQSAYMPTYELIKPDKYTHNNKPAGFIFHLSRCGSTVLSEMFRPLLNCQVVAESEAIGNMFQTFNCSEEIQVLALQNMIGLFQHTLCANGEELIIKLSSWNAVTIKIFQMAFPDTPCFFLYRDPSEVMVSMLKNPPSWLDRKKIAIKLEENKRAKSGNLECDFYTEMLARVNYTDTLSNTELYARLLGDICRSIANTPQPILSMDYTSLPESMPDIIAPYFGIKIKSTDLNRIMAASQRDTKEISSKKPFVPDSENKQKAVTEEIKRAVECHILPKLEQVKRESLSADRYKLKIDSSKHTLDDSNEKTKKALQKKQNRETAIVKWL